MTKPEQTADDDDPGVEIDEVPGDLTPDEIDPDSDHVDQKDETDGFG